MENKDTDLLLSILIVIYSAFTFLFCLWFYRKGYLEGHKKGVDFGKKIEKECTQWAFVECFKQDQKEKFRQN